MAKPWLCVYVQCCCTGYSIENNLIPGAFDRMHDHAMTDHFFLDFVTLLLLCYATTAASADCCCCPFGMKKPLDP